MLYLAEADDMEVVQTFTQGSAAVNPGTFIGEGKIEEIRAVGGFKARHGYIRLGI